MYAVYQPEDQEASPSMRLVDLVNLPTWLSLFLGVILPTLLYAGLSAWVQKRTEQGNEFFHGESARIVGTYLVSVVGLILGFMLVNAVNVAVRAEETVFDEADALKTLTRLFQQLPPSDRTALLTIEDRYIIAIHQDEWPAMHSNNDFEYAKRNSRQMLEAMYDGIGQLKDLNRQQTQASVEALKQLSRISELRHSRLWLATGAMPDIVWLLMMFVTTLALLVLAVNTSRGAKRYPLLVGAYALTITSLLYFVAVLQYPFSGPIHVDSTPLQKVRPLVSP